MRLLLVLLALSLAAPTAHAQDFTVERDGTQITITRPDGTVERFTVDEDTPLRVRSENGALIVEDEDGVRRRGEVRGFGDGPAVHLERFRDGERPRAFAFRSGGPFPHLGEFEMELDLDSLARGLEGMRWFSGDGSGFAFEHVVPGLRMRGTSPETRRAIADGERASHALACELRSADGAQRDSLAAELRQTLERTFDLKQQARREQVERMQEETERLRDEAEALQDELAERDRLRREIIEDRERELLGERDGMRW